MRWLRRLLRVPEVEFKPIRIEGDPIGDFTLDHWKAISEMYRRVEGLEWVTRAAFDAAMADLRKCLTGDKSHLELVRIGQKLSDLWELLNMPRTATAEANKILESMKTEQTQPDRPGPRNVI
jgi:hypothetical protein